MNNGAVHSVPSGQSSMAATGANRHPAQKTDRITILTSDNDRPQRKIFEGPAPFEELSSYCNSYLYKVETAEFRTLEEFKKILNSISGDGCKAVIRGEPLEDFGTTRVRKLSRPRARYQKIVRDGKTVNEPKLDGGGQVIFDEPTFKDVPRRWQMIDVDKVDRDLWRGLDPVADAQKIARRYRATLPPWLAEAKMLVQLSSSHGLPMNVGVQVKMHLWFLTDRSIGFEDSRALMYCIGQDPATARTVQHLYTASPMFFDRITADSLPDPVGCRWFIIDGKDEAILPPPSDPMWTVGMARHGRGAGVSAGPAPLIGYEPDYIRTGWRGMLDEAGSDNAGGHYRDAVMRATSCFLSQEGWDADDAEFRAELEPVFDRLRQARGEGDVMGYRENFAEIMRDFRENDRAAAMGRVGEAVKTRTRRTEAPPVPFPYPPRREARGGAPEPSWAPERRLDLRGVGEGKTRELLITAVNLLEQIDENQELSGAGLLQTPEPMGDRVYFQVQSHRLAEEIETTLREIIGDREIDTIIWRGMEREDPEDATHLMCRRMPDMRAALSSGGEFRDVCGVRGGDMCPYSRHNGGIVCGTHRQELAAAAMRRRPAIVILAGAYFAAHVPPERLRPKAATKGVEVVRTDGTSHRVFLPDALLIVLDEWRPTEAHLLGTAIDFVADSDLEIVGRDTRHKPSGAWQEMVDISAVETARRLCEDPDVVRAGEMAALQLLCQVLPELAGGLMDNVPLDFSTLKDALWRASRPVRIDGELHELPRVFASPGDEISIALRAVKKLIRKPRDIGRAVSAASIDGMWENSKIEAMGEDVRRDDREMAPVDLVKIIRHNARLLRVRRLLEALQQSYDDAIARGGSGPLLGIRKATHLLHRGTMTIPGYRWAMREPLTPGLDNVPVVVLDATAEPDIVERWLGKTNQIRDPAPRKMNPNVLVRQIVDAQIGYTAVNKAKWISRLRAFIWAAALQHWNEARGPYDVAVVLPKSVLKKIGMLPSRVVAITWGSESGLNVAEHVVRGIVISRKLPSSGDVSFASEITFGMPVEDKDYTFKRADRLVRGDDGRSYSYEGGRGRGLAVSRHPDPHAEIIRRQWCDGSFEQGLGRFRIHRRTEETPLLLDIITNHPSAEVAVDQLLTLASFKREIDAVELRLMAAGVTLRSGTYGAASIGALVSGKLSELLRREMDNTLTNIDNFKTEHADALEKCRKRVLRMAIDSQAKARKRQENRESGENAESGILPIRTVYNNNRGSPTFSSGWTLPQMDRGAGTKAAAVLQITPGTRPMKVQIRLDPAEGCDREFALERIQNFSGAFPIHSIVYDDATFPRLIDGKVERGPTTHESE